MYAVGSVCTSGLPGIQMSPEEQEKCLAMRREAFRKYRVLAITTTALSVVSITIGIVILVLAKGGGFPLTSGVPIWAGAIILVGSGFGIALGFSNPEWKTDGDKNRQRCFVMVYYIMAVTSFSCVGLCIGYSAWSLAECVNKDDDNKICPTNFDALTALNAIAMIIAFIFFICSMCVAIMFCYYRKAFHFQSRQDRAAAIQRVLIEQQQQIAVLQRQQQSQMGPNPPQYQYTQNQGMGYGATHYGSEYGTKYSSPPPSYFSSASGNKI